MFRSFVLACLVASAAAFRQPRLAIQMKAQENLQKKVRSSRSSVIRKKPLRRAAKRSHRQGHTSLCATSVRVE